MMVDLATVPPLIATLSGLAMVSSYFWTKGSRLHRVESDPRVVAAYLFYGTGEPLVALSSVREFPVEPERLEEILDAIGGFLHRSLRPGPSIEVTALRFNDIGAIAVRGQYVVAAALYEGSSYVETRKRRIAFVRTFEARRWKELPTWKQAVSWAEEASQGQARLLIRPEAAFGLRGSDANRVQSEQWKRKAFPASEGVDKVDTAP